MRRPRHPKMGCRAIGKEKEYMIVDLEKYAALAKLIILCNVKFFHIWA
jgi:hypothetical protein